MSQKHLPCLTFLNVLACFSVIMLHNNNFWDFSPGPQWVSANLIESLFYFAVPVFYMITGATLLEYSERYSTKVFFLNRIKKALIPFLFWSVAAAGWQTVKLAAAGQPIDLRPTTLLDGILNTRYMSIYWFFIPLFMIYLSMPVLTMLADRLSACRYMTVLGVLFVGLFPLLLHLAGVPENPDFVPPVVCGYLLFPVMGYYLSRQPFRPVQRYVIYLLGFLGLLAQFLGTWALSADGIDQTFKGYTNLPSILYSAAVFLAARQLSIPARLDSVLRWFAKRTFGIYLIHYYVIGIFSLVPGLDRSSLLWRTAGSAVVFLACSALVYLLQKLPFVQKLVP